MVTTRHLPRSPWIALAAIVAALLVTGHSSASAGMVGGRMAEMRRDGCCCIVLPVGGCCCEPAAPTGPGSSSAPAGSTRVVRTASPAVDPVGPASSCACRASDPVMPVPRSEPPGADGRSERPVGTTFLATTHDADALAHVVRLSSPTIRSPRVLLDLRTTHLLI